VTTHYNGGIGKYGEPEPGLVAGYHFDEGTGTTTSDYSGEENHGTIVGATWQESTIALSVTYVYDVAVTRLVATPAMVQIGDTVYINVTVKNLGNATETFTLTTNYGGYAQVETITNLPPGNETMFYYVWDTTGEETCFHTISALASPVSGETYIHNNFRSTGVRIVSLIPQPATVKVEPSSILGIVRGSFEVNVTVNDLDAYWDMVGFNIKLYYNTTLLNATGVSIGDFAEYFNLTYQVKEEINEEESYVWIAYMSDPTKERTSPFGSGTLATITFLVTELGEGNFTLNDVKLAAFGNATKWCIPYSLNIDYMTVDGRIETKFPMFGDINFDGTVDIFDIVAACMAYDARPGDPNWNPYADIAPEFGIIDIYDIVTITFNYGVSDP